LAIILPANTLAAASGVANSCRFNDGDSPQLHRSQPGTPTSTKIFTWSGWFKLGSSTSQITLASSFTSGSIYDQIKIMAKATHNQVLRIEAGSNEGNAIDLKTTISLRDPSAWMHLCLAVDTSQGVAANRDKVYINGTQITSWATETHSTQNDTWHMNASGKTIKVGLYDNGTPQDFFDGYLAEVVQVDGQQLAPTSFGEYDEDSPTIWKPIDVSGLTFGNNGYYLDFENSSALGNDVAGKGDFTVANLAAADQATDTPTNNFCTMNPLDNYFAAGTFSEGNCKVVTNASNTTWGTSTFGLSAGKWYFEVKFEGTLGGGENAGIVDRVTDATSQKAYNASGGKNAVWRSGGDLYVDDSNDTDFTPGGGDLWASDDILGVFLDLDNNKIYCAINGSIIISGAGADITAVASTLNNAYFIIAGDSNTASTNFEFNFGGCSAFAISSAVSDSNGYGNFEFSPNQGGASNFDSAAKNFLAICTKNLGSDGG
jgi:hypothetical protein